MNNPIAVLNSPYRFGPPTLVDVATSEPTNADVAPTWQVYEDGSPMASQNGTLSLLDSEVGVYEGTFTPTAANGFESGKDYTILVEAQVDGVAGKYKIGFVIDVRVSTRLATSGYTAPPAPITIVEELEQSSATFQQISADAAAAAALNPPSASDIAAAVAGETPPVEFFTNAPSGEGGGGGDPSDWSEVKALIETNLDAKVSLTGGQPLSPMYETDGRIWHYPNIGQLTGKPNIVEQDSYDGLLVMDLTNVLAPDVSILSAELVSVTNDDDIDVATPIQVSPNRKKVHLVVDTETAGTYEFVVKVTTTDSQSFNRKGVLTIR